MSNLGCAAELNIMTCLMQWYTEEFLEQLSCFSPTVDSQQSYTTTKLLAT